MYNNPLQWRRLQRLRKLVDRLTSGRRRGTARRAARLRARMQQLARQLTRKAALIPTTALLLGLPGTATAQTSFGPAKVNPFGLPADLQTIHVPTYADIDGDGDFDILAMTYDYDSDQVSVEFFENTGTADTPQFAAPVTDPFGISHSPTEEAVGIALVDLDADGDLDLLTGGYDVFYHENTGTVTEPEFIAPTVNPFGLDIFGTVTNDYLLPSFADMDADGDSDLLIATYGNLFYLENIGTNTAAQFDTVQGAPFDIDLSFLDEDYFFPAIVDLDQDGDLDMLVSAYDNPLLYFENIGTPQAPAFTNAVISPFGLGNYNVDGILIGDFVDMDADGDADLLFSEYYNDISWVYFENTTPPVNVEPLPADFALDFAPQPAFNEVYLRTNYPLHEAVLFDVLGNQVRRLPVGTDRLSVAGLAPGTYVFRAALPNGARVTRRISVAR